MTLLAGLPLMTWLAGTLTVVVGVPLLIVLAVHLSSRAETDTWSLDLTAIPTRTKHATLEYAVRFGVLAELPVSNAFMPPVSIPGLVMLIAASPRGIMDKTGTAALVTGPWCSGRHQWCPWRR